MSSLALCAIGVVLLDQALTRLLREALGGRSVRLGPLGELRLVPARIWVARLARRASPRALWLVWAIAAAALVAGTALTGRPGWWAGLLVGGSLSHALAMARHGHVHDYVCLRGWPAFDLADAALTAGALGGLLELAAAFAAWR